MMQSLFYFTFHLFHYYTHFYTLYTLVLFPHLLRTGFRTLSEHISEFIPLLLLSIIISFYSFVISLSFVSFVICFIPSHIMTFRTLQPHDTSSLLSYSHST